MSAENLPHNYFFFYYLTSLVLLKLKVSVKTAVCTNKKKLKLVLMWRHFGNKRSKTTVPNQFNMDIDLAASKKPLLVLCGKRGTLASTGQGSWHNNKNSGKPFLCSVWLVSRCLLYVLKNLLHFHVNKQRNFLYIFPGMYILREATIIKYQLSK